MWYLVSSKSYLQGIFYKGVTKIDWSLILIILIGISIFFNARKTRSLIFVQSIALLFGMVIINLILFIILFSLAIILADSFNALRIGSIFTLSMWVIVLSGLIHFLFFFRSWYRIYRLFLQYFHNICRYLKNGYF